MQTNLSILLLIINIFYLKNELPAQGYIVDSTFADNGYLRVNIEDSSYWVSSIESFEDGSLMASGRIQSNNVSKPFVQKILTNGSIDMDFGNEGIIFLDTLINKPTIEGPIYRSRLSKDGNVLLLLQGQENNTEKIFVVKIDQNGMLVNDFGVNGLFEYKSPYSDAIFADVLEVDDHGEIYVIGREFYGKTILVIKLTADGEIDNSFNNDGVFRDSLEFNGAVNGADLDDQFNLYLAGQVYNGVSWTGLLMKLNTLGELDEGFSNTGKYTIVDDTGNAYLSDVSINNNCVLLCGINLGDTYRVGFVSKISSDGVIDPMFGVNGYDYMSGDQIFEGNSYRFFIERPGYTAVSGGSSESGVGINNVIFFYDCSGRTVSQFQNEAIVIDIGENYNLKAIVFDREDNMILSGFVAIVREDPLLIIKILNNANITKTEDLKLNSKNIRLYPNPSSEVINLEYDNLNFNCFGIYDLKGKCMAMSKKAEGEYNAMTINLADIPSGSYYVYLFDENRMVIAIKKFVRP